MTASKKLKAVKLIKDLISIPSISGSEYEIGEYISDYLDSIGLSPLKQEVYKGGNNVLVELGNGEKSILIEAHMDVVPPWDMNDAFNPVVENGIIRGRGACDTKGGLASTLLALEELVKAENKINDKLIFAYVVDEKLYGRGAKELLIRGVNADYGIIIEPTDLTLSISIAGCVEFEIESFGVSGHGASQSNNNNAVENLIRLLSRIRQLPLLHEKGDLKYMQNILNIGRIMGGESAWMIPSYAKSELLLHFIPRYTFDEIWDILVDYIRREEKGLDGKFNIKYLHGCDGYILDKNDKFITHVESIIRKLLKTNNVLSHMPSESDANELYHKGGIKAVIFGPGDLRVAHSSMEYVRIEDVLKAADILSKIFIS